MRMLLDNRRGRDSLDASLGKRTNWPGYVQRLSTKYLLREPTLASTRHDDL